MRLLISILPFSFFAFSALAASGGGHGEVHGVPWTMVLQQTFNLGLAIFIIIYFAGGNIKSYFAKRREEFTLLLRKAEEAKASAEKQKREVTERLQKLNSKQDTFITEAKSEAEELKKKILNDALTLSSRLETEAEKSVVFEIERAKFRLRNELLSKSMETSKQSLPKMIDGNKTSALNNQFIDNLQVTQ